MSIVACPKCHEEISLPHASPQARVRCPLCLDEYQLAEVLEKLPPALVVLDDPAAQDSGVGRSGGWSGDSAISAFGSAEQAGGHAGFDFDQRSAGTATEAKPAAGVRRRKPRKPKKPLVEVLKVVGGGAAGIIIAMLIIWWVAGKDPFKLAPKIASFAPFIVPDHLEKAGGSDKAEEPGDEENPKTKPSGTSGTPTTNTPSSVPTTGSFGGALNQGITVDDGTGQQDSTPKNRPKTVPKPVPNELPEEDVSVDELILD